MNFLYLIAGISVGFGVAWLLFTKRGQSEQLSLVEKVTEAEKKLIQISAERDSLLRIYENQQKQFESQSLEYKEINNTYLSKIEFLTSDLSKAETELQHALQRLVSQKNELEEVQQKFSMEFENIASRILKENSKELTESSRKNIDEILTPLKEKLGSFEQKVQDTHEKSLRDSISLREEVKKLYELNARISQEANNLTHALKGDTKKQGNWGELVLDKILERTGLTKGVEYEVQFSTRNQDGELLRPDVLVKLPDNKHIIIDSKVSLIAYEQYVNSEDTTQKERFAKQHIDSVHNHVKGLSEKSYQLSTDIHTPDFVLLFMPIESAFSLAIQNDPELFTYAWERRIVIVSPTTLLATLKTVESIWKQEKQSANALEIANEGGKLYDKFVLLLNDFDKLGNQLGTLQKTYGDIYKKMNGSGNIVVKIENLRKLGARVSKQIPDKYLGLKETEDSDNQSNNALFEDSPSS